MSGGRWFLLPALLATFLLAIVPLLVTLGLALFEFDALSPPRWVGLEHFKALAADPMFRQALHNSLLLVAVAVPLRLVLALVLGLLLARTDRWSRLGLPPTLLPTLLPELVWAMAWLWILNPWYGPAAWVLDATHPQGAEWILSATGARTAIVCVLALLIGEMVLILRAARRLIPDRHYEICAVEGASAWHGFRRVTWPQLAPLFGLLALRDVALCLQLSFVPALIVTKTGPQFSTLYLPYYTWQNAFEYLRFGYAAASGSLLVLWVLLALGLQLLLLRRWQAGHG